MVTPDVFAALDTPTMPNGGVAVPASPSVATKAQALTFSEKSTSYKPVAGVCVATLTGPAALLDRASVPSAPTTAKLVLPKPATEVCSAAIKASSAMTRLVRPGRCLDGSGNLKEGMAVRLARFS